MQREESMGGLAKGLAIMECFSRNRPRLTVSEAATLTDITPASARRCLRTLEGLGYLSYDGKFFRPTPRMTRLSTSYTNTNPLPLLAQPLLADLRDQINESCSLVVLDGNSALFIARAESTHVVSTGFSIGSRLPLYSSSAGRVLLAAFDDDDLQNYLRDVRPQSSTPNALTTIAAIRDRVQQIRRDGYSINDEEIELGLRAVAVPVVDVGGKTVACVVISALAARTSFERLHEEFLPKLLVKARDLGKML
ncbi:IclR family transcriptional regulator [Microbacterium pseudoresistens]